MYCVLFSTDVSSLEQVQGSTNLPMLKIAWTAPIGIERRYTSSVLKPKPAITIDVN